jgi:hypothetical protein
MCWRLSELGADEREVANGRGLQADANKLLEKIVTQIEEAFEDFKAVVVVTAAADTDAQVKFNIKHGDFSQEIQAKITAMASTRMDVDGDVYTMIPAKTNEPEIRQEVMTLHKQNIALATENWKKFLDGVLTIVEIGADIANIELPNVRNRMLTTISPSVSALPPVTR